VPRPKRKKLDFTEDSVNKLLQEIYDESHNIKAKINRLFTKWETKVKETGEVAAIGDQIVKLISAEAKNQDQKIMLLKYLKEVVSIRKNLKEVVTKVIRVTKQKFLLREGMSYYKWFKMN
jgi:hypothetical protein